MDGKTMRNMWTDLDNSIKRQIEQQKEIVAKFIEANRLKFTKEQVVKYNSKETVTMLQLPSFSYFPQQYFFYLSDFYCWDGNVRYTSGMPQDKWPRVVNLMEGPKLHDLIRNEKFINALL